MSTTNETVTVRAGKGAREARKRAKSKKGARKKNARHDRLFALRQEVRHKIRATYDYETRARSGDGKGFELAFLAGFFDGTTYTAYRDQPRDVAPRLYKLPATKRHHAPGGLTDRLCRSIFGRIRNGEVVGARTDLTSDHAVIYAHNGGQFDCMFLIPWLRRHKSEFIARYAFAMSRIISFTVTRRATGNVSGKRKHRKKSDTWLFVDSALLLPMTLEKAGKLFARVGADSSAVKDADQASATSKKKWDLDLPTDACLHCFQPRAKHLRGTAPATCPGYEDGWERYNEIDCRVLANALEGYRALLESLGGELGVTASDCAMRLLRRRYLTIPVERHQHFGTCDGKCNVGFGDQIEREPCLSEWYMRSFVGGRCEIFRTRASRHRRIYDLNACFAAAQKELMPAGKIYELDGDEYALWAPALRRQGYVGAVEATFWIPPTCHIPPLPLKHADPKGDVKLTFPVGYVTTVINDAELALLYECGGCIVGKVTRYVAIEGRDIFSDFVDAIYDYRLQYKTAVEKHGEDSDEARRLEPMDALAKIMLTSSYGKFAQHAIREEVITTGTGADFPDCPYGAIPYDLRDDPVTADLWRVPRWQDATYIIPQIASAITSIARAKLYRSMRTVIALGGSVAYSDTDSMHVEPPAGLSDADVATWFAELERAIGVSQTELGAWKHEKPKQRPGAPAAPGGEYIRPKTYAADGAVKIKGVPRRDAVTDENIHTPENFAKYAAGEPIEFSRVTRPRAVLRGDLDGPQVVRDSRRINTDYTKRIIVGGGETRPIELDERGNVVEYRGDKDRADRTAILAARYAREIAAGQSSGAVVDALAHQYAAGGVCRGCGLRRARKKGGWVYSSGPGGWGATEGVCLPRRAQKQQSA